MMIKICKLPIQQVRIHHSTAIVTAFMIIFLLGAQQPTSASQSNKEPPSLMGSIFSYIRSNIDPNTGELKEQAYQLPDEQRMLNESGLHWVPAALEREDSLQLNQQRSQIYVNKIGEALEKISKTNTEPSMVELYKLLLNDNIAIHIDAIVKNVAARNLIPNPYLHDYLAFLIQKSLDRGPIKLSIAVLGLVGTPKDLELIKTIGLHEEFTRYSAMAIDSLLTEADDELWSLAKKVNGWGRIQIVERLANTENKHIRDWVLRQGYKNSISYEHLAYIAATTGDLNSALRMASIDDGLMAAAGDIVAGLIQGGPAQDINSYQHAALALGNYLRHVTLRKKRPKLEFLLVTYAISNYVSDQSWDQKSRALNGWDRIMRDQVRKRANKIIAWRLWPKLTQEQLSNPAKVEFFQANRAAKILAIDTWQAHWKRLNDEPTNSGRWYEVMQLANDNNIADIINLAKTKLPLEEISTGPANEMGIGPEYNIHSCLDLILQDLGKFPTQGWPLIHTGLKSPVIHNRVMALRALQTWDSKNWSEDMRVSLKKVYELEPEKNIKQGIMTLIGNP